MTELRGSVPTRVPKPRVVPTAPPRVASVGSRVPVARVVETPLPSAVVLPTRVPGPTVVPTKLPPWVRKIMVAIAAEAEIRVQVVGVEMDGTEALRGQGAITVEPVSIETGTTPKEIGGRGRIEALVGMVLDAGARELAARGAVAAVNAVMALPAGIREIRAQGLVQAVRTAYQLAPAGQSVRGRGAITVSGVSQALIYPTYQMTKSGTQAGQGTGYNTLTGMVADAGYPGTIVDNSAALRIPDGLPSYPAVVRAEVPHTGGTPPRYGQSQIYMNGSLVATGAQQSASPGTSTVEWSGSVQAGDYFVIQWRGEGNFFNRPTAQAGAFLRVTPQ